MRRAFLPALVVALAIGLLPDAPAAANTCLPAGGATLPPHDDLPSGDFLVLGRGWGHGVGMSQHGVQGAANLGCTVEQITSTYYPGTTLRDRDTDRPIIVGLWPDRPPGSGGHRIQALRVYANENNAAGVRWRSGDSDLPTTQAPGAMWRVDVKGSGFEVFDVTGNQAPSDDNRIWSGGDQFTPLRVLMDGDHVVQLPAKSSRADWPAGRPYRYGRLVFDAMGAGQMDVRVELPSLETYLRGLAEVPSSWHERALQVQAIAGRSYALDRVQRLGRKPFCDCHVYDSASDQVYNGLLKESEGSDNQFGNRWVGAVEATRRRTLDYQGQIAEAYYSSTHGGHSERLQFSSFFSGSVSFPYLQPVDDSRWEVASSSDHAPAGGAGRGTALRWAHGYSAEQIGQAFGVGVAREVNLPNPRGAGGRVGHPDRTAPNGQRYGGVEIVGTDGTKVVSGLQFVQRLNVNRRSELFTVVRGDGKAVDSCLPHTDQSSNTTVTRTFGRERIETAVAVSKDHWEAADDVVLATSANFPDALAAGVLAANLDAPLLLTSPTEFADAVRVELQRLDAQRVHLMGGHAAITHAVEDALRRHGHEVVRVAGRNRYETAAEAAVTAGPSPTGDVALALGENWPDAVSAGALAASPDRVPTLLSNQDSVPPVTLEALKALGAERVLLIGGVAALAESVADQVRAAGYEVVRLSGPTRFETSVAVATDAGGRAERNPHRVVLATGEAFPDALAATALGATTGANLVLTPRCRIHAAVEGFLAGNGFESGVIVGGTAAVSDRVREQATAAINGDG